MDKVVPPIVKRSLFSWIFYKNTHLQLVLVLIILVTVFARVLPLEMQKRIVNQAINLRKIDLLLSYCAIYLASVLLASGLKYVSNILQTIISERTLAEMRKDLYHRILTLPLTFFRNNQAGTIVASLVTELTLPANFIGMSVAVPITNALTLLAFAGYLLYLNPMLGLLSFSIYPMVLVIVPRLQIRVNEANKRRLNRTRELSNQITESVGGIHEIHGNGSYRIENRKFDRISDRLYKVRIIWSMYRGAIKVTNNFFTSLGPFLIFILGGYLAIKGQLELGALVAFISAQEKLYDPWKELIEFYQVFQDGRVNYKRTMTFFDHEPEYAIEPADRPPYDLGGGIEVENLSYETESGIQLLGQVSLRLEPGQQLALVGFSGSGKSTLANCIAQLYKYTSGTIRIGEKEVSELTKQDMVHNTGIVSQSPFIFNGTIEENLVYGCLAKSGKDEIVTGIKDPALPTLDDMIAVLQQTGFFVDALRMGLRTILDPVRHTDLVDVLVRVRKNFQRNFGRELSDYVEFFSLDNYLRHSTIAENILFGAPNRENFYPEQLCSNTYFLRFLETAELKRPLLTLGAELARQTVDILGNLPPDKIFFKQSPVNADQLDQYKEVAERTKKTRLFQLAEADQRLLLELALRFRPGRHKMLALPEILEQLILEGRAYFREKITIDDPNAFTFYDMAQYIHSETIENNIFFGKTTSDSSRAQEKITQSIIQLLIEEDLLEQIVAIGLEFQVGSKGDKLSGGQRQKLAIARAFLKNPRILIMDEATSALDNKSQARIQNLLETFWKGRSTVVSVVHRLDTVKNYDFVAVMKSGRMTEIGTYDELLARKGMLYELVSGNT